MINEVLKNRLILSFYHLGEEIQVRTSARGVYIEGSEASKLGIVRIWDLAHGIKVTYNTQQQELKVSRETSISFLSNFLPLEPAILMKANLKKIHGSILYYGKEIHLKENQHCKIKENGTGLYLVTNGLTDEDKLDAPKGETSFNINSEGFEVNSFMNMFLSGNIITEQPEVNIPLEDNSEIKDDSDDDWGDIENQILNPKFAYQCLSSLVNRVVIDSQAFLGMDATQEISQDSPPSPLVDNQLVADNKTASKEEINKIRDIKEGDTEEEKEEDGFVLV